MRKNKKTPLGKIDEGLMNFYLHADLDSLREVMREDGFDPEKNEPKRQQLAKKIQFAARAQLNQSKHSLLLEKATSRIQEILENNLEKPISRLRAIIEGRGLASQYRNLEKLGVEEIREMLNDIDIVNLLDELEEGDENND